MTGGIAVIRDVFVITEEENASDDQLDDYVQRSREASVYHCSRWRKVIKESFGHNSYYLFSRNAGGRISGILPLVHLKSLLFGNMLISVPYFNYGGVCADDDSTQARLIDEAERVAKERNVTHIEYRQEKPFHNGYAVKTTKVSMRLDLPTSSDDLWKTFPSKLRSQVAKPQKVGMTFRIGKMEELKEFYAVFSTNMRDLGTPVYPIRFFRCILQHFPENSWICNVYMAGIPVASGFLIGFKEKMEIPWASSLKKYNRMSPNMLLYWCCMKFACEQGYGIFDFGRSTPGEGTYRFKEQWGAKPVQLYWNYWLPEGKKLPEINPGNEKYRLAIQCWKRLPVALTNMIGPRIIKNIP